MLADAIEDLKRKRLELTSAHYGPVHFLLAYAAAGKEFQWFWMSSDGKQVSSVLSAIHGAVCVRICSSFVLHDALSSEEVCTYSACPAATSLDSLWCAA